jgi:hypothetical protein
VGDGQTIEVTETPEQILERHFGLMGKEWPSTSACRSPLPGNRLIARMQFPEPLPRLVVAALNRRTAGTAAAYVTKTTVKMQIWFDSSEGSTLILQQSKGQPVLEGRYFFPGDS